MPHFAISLSDLCTYLYEIKKAPKEDKTDLYCTIKKIKKRKVLRIKKSNTKANISHNILLIIMI